MLFRATAPAGAARTRVFGTRAVLPALIAATLLLLFFAVSPQRSDAASLARNSDAGVVCKGQYSTNAPVRVQVQAMRCLINYTRLRHGLPRLRPSKKLDVSSRRKSIDIMRCGNFDHNACGRDFTFWMHKVGYTRGCWAAAENIAWGQHHLGNPHQIFQAWMRSAGHRQNILSRNFNAFGVGLRKGSFQGHNGARVWTTHFGKRC